jgi:hypothetical protein
MEGATKTHAGKITRETHLLLHNSITPTGQRTVFTLGNILYTDIYKEFYDLRCKSVLFYFIIFAFFRHKVHLAYKGQVVYKVIK